MINHCEPDGLPTARGHRGGAFQAILLQHLEVADVSLCVGKKTGLGVLVWVNACQANGQGLTAICGGGNNCSARLAHRPARWVGKGEIKFVVIEPVWLSLCSSTRSVNHPLGLPAVLAGDLGVLGHLVNVELVCGPDHCLQSQVVARVTGVEPVVGARWFAACLSLHAPILLLILKHTDHRQHGVHVVTRLMQVLCAG